VFGRATIRLGIGPHSRFYLHHMCVCVCMYVFVGRSAGEPGSAADDI